MLKTNLLVWSSSPSVCCCNLCEQTSRRLVRCCCCAARRLSAVTSAGFCVSPPCFTPRGSEMVSGQIPTRTNVQPSSTTDKMLRSSVGTSVINFASARVDVSLHHSCASLPRPPFPLPRRERALLRFASFLALAAFTENPFGFSGALTKPYVYLFVVWFPFACGRKRVCDRGRDGLGLAGRVWDDREPTLLVRGVLAHGQQHQGVEALRGRRQ